ncbi:MAG TPA: hypothetical protein VG796_08320, partial [Verrucomicrobiales bacterium]|nr:hypothetical protein [Verrucomicrobiales bacterium]
MKRNGKIARLPRALRDELNRQLERGVPGPHLLAWLNSLPEVREVLDDHFDGRPISEQNLSEWRNGGFVEWQLRNELLDRARDAAETAEDLDQTAGRMADHAARLLAARYGIALAAWDGNPDAPALTDLKKLAPLVRDLHTLRRGELHSARVRMQEYAFHRNWQHRRGTSSPLPTDSSFRPTPPEPSFPPPEPVLPPPSSPPESNRIKPNQTTLTPPTRRKPRPAPSPNPPRRSTTASPPPPAHSSIPDSPLSPSTHSSTNHSPLSPAPNPSFPSAIVTNPNVTIPSSPLPESDPDWQMRYGEIPEPAWRPKPPPVPP